MANSAEKLIEIFEKWKKVNRSTAVKISQRRGTGWESTRDAARHLIEIEDFVDRFPEMREQQKTVLAAAWKHIVQPDRQWGASDQEDFAANAAAAIRGIGYRMDASPGSGTSLTPNEIETIQDAFDEIRTELASIRDLTQVFRTHIEDLVDQFGKVVTAEAPDFARAEALTHQIIGATAVAGPAVPAESAGKVKAAFARISAIFGKSIMTTTTARATNKLIDMGAEAIQQTLESGQVL